MRRKLLVLPVLVAGMIGLSHGQPPGGGFPGGGGGFPGGGKGGMRMQFGGGGQPPDPEQMWTWIAKGQPTINLNDPANAMMKDRMVRQGQAIPPDGILTKDAFKANFQASMAKRAAEGGGTPGAPTVAFQTGGQPGGGGPNQWGGGGGPGGGRGGPGGFDPASMTDDQLRMSMRRDDADGDGRISAAEAANSRSDALRDGFAQFDTNRDGFIDATEYRSYLTVRMQQRQQNQQFPGQGGTPGQPMPVQTPGGPQGAPGQPTPPGTPTPGQPASDEPARPEVLRYGKLPKGAPSWMLAPTASNKDGLDADRDGQIGLYEWRRAGKKIADFVEMDLNGDGYLTYLEWKTYHERLAEKQKAEDPDAPTPMIINPGSGGAGGGFERGPKGGGGKGDRGPKGDRQPKGEKGQKGGRNPFASSNKGGA